MNIGEPPGSAQTGFGGVCRSIVRLEVLRLTEQSNQSAVQIQELDVELTNTKELIQLAEEDLRLQRNELARTLVSHPTTFICNTAISVTVTALLEISSAKPFIWRHVLMG